MNSPSSVVFHPGVSHNHRPCGRWYEIKLKPKSSFRIGCICSSVWSPQQVISIAKIAEFQNKPIALKHLDWYLVEGKGRTLNENDNLRDMLTKDKGVLSAINRDIPILQTKGTYKGHIKLEQGDYADQDFRYAFGAIDRLDFEVDFDKKTLHAWFQDRYEWHPVYPGLYKKYPGDVERETNCVHAALVEMKLSGAADYWMKGEAKVPLKLTTSAPTTDRSGDYDSVS